MKRRKRKPIPLPVKLAIASFLGAACAFTYAEATYQAKPAEATPVPTCKGHHHIAKDVAPVIKDEGEGAAP